MEAFFWYGIALLSVVVALVLRRARSKINSTGRWVAGHIQHRVLVSRGSWSSVTIGLPDAIVLSLFLAANAILSLSSQNIANLAVLNMLPLFLGGRTNVQADYLGMSLPIYQLTHHWLARVFAVQGLLHSGLSFSRADGAGRAAGVAAAGLIIASLVASLLPVRRWSPTLFRWVHLVLSLTILCGVGIHTVLMTGSFASFSSILCFVAAGLLGASWILRLGRQLYQGPAEVVHYEVLHNAIRLWVRVRHGIPTHSGTYFYVRFPNLSLRAMFQSRLTPVAFWKTASRGSTKDISFIVPHSKDLATYLRRGRPLDLRLDGPYGEQLGLEQYELVVLVADGEGIAGVISLALSILSRRKWDEEDKTQGLRSKLHCDKTRKVDLVWKLQDNAQVEWASPYFTALSEIEFVTADERKKKLARSLLMVWVLYPDEFEPGVHVPREKAWIECQTSAEQYPDLLSGLILKESSRTPGESIILTCGTGPFVQQTRAAIRQSRSAAVAFKELEYRPGNKPPTATKPRPNQTLRKAAAARSSVAQAFNKQIRNNRVPKPGPPHVQRATENTQASGSVPVDKPLPPIRNKQALLDRRRARVFARDTNHGLSLTVND